MNTAMHLTKCAKFGCNERFFNWNAVEFNYCGELHRTCSYACLHAIKQAVTCRIQQKHRAIVQATIAHKHKDLTKVWGK